MAKKKRRSEHVIGSRFQRAQEYLGLRASDGGGQDGRQGMSVAGGRPQERSTLTTTTTTTTTTKTTTNVSDGSSAASRQILTSTPSVHAWSRDYNKLAPFPPHRDVVLVSLDIECYERNHSCITEIGIATLDVRDLRGLKPGKNGEIWRKAIRTHHWLIREYAHLRNKDYVHDAAHLFEFGTSEWISHAEIPKVVAACFHPGATGPLADVGPNQSTRNIVVVGHAVDGDLNYLQGVGYHVRQLNHLVDVLDVGVIDRDLNGDTQSRALGSIIYSLNIEGWSLHNAGNDAVYALQGLLAMAVRYQHGIKEAIVAPKVSGSDEEKSDEDLDDMGGQATATAAQEKQAALLEAPPMTEEW